MKTNLPVTGQERIFPANKTLVSKTDTKGIITFANQNFIEVSGYSEKDLLGSNHNIIRHPDMPAAAFETMWRTLERGLPWNGIVKNRCRNGDHYWVNAKVVPIKKQGRIIGYMSVRTCPSRDEIDKAQALYAAAAGAPETIRLQIAPSWTRHLSIRNGIPLWIIIVTLMMIAGGILGITGLTLSNSAIQSLYHEEMGPVTAIGRVNFLMADNRAQIALALQHSPSTHPSGDPENMQDHRIADHLRVLSRNKEEIDRLWDPYAKSIANPAERELATQYWSARNQYVQEGLMKAVGALERSDFVQAEQILTLQVTPLYDKANSRVSLLLKHLTDRGQSNFMEVTQRNDAIIAVAIAGISLCCLGLSVAGFFFYRFTGRPLEKAVLALEAIAEGNLSGNVDTRGYGEPGRVMAAVRVMQMHLKVMMHEIRQSSDSIRQQCHSLNQTMMNMAQHAEEQHDRVYQTLDAVTGSYSSLVSLANAADQLAPTGEQQAPVLTAKHPLADLQDNRLEPMPQELLALFGEPATEKPPQATAQVQTANAHTASKASPLDGGDLVAPINAIAETARIQAMAVEDASSHLKQVAALIVQSREEVNSAWTASQELEKTACELEKLIQYFE